MMRLTHLDAVMGCLRSAGFSPAMAARARAAIDSYVRGFALQEHVLPSNNRDIAKPTEQIIAQQTALAARFPHIVGMADGLDLQPAARRRIRRRVRVGPGVGARRDRGSAE